MGMGLADKALRAFRVALGLPANPSEPPALMNLPLCWAKVLGQNADGTLELMPLDRRYAAQKNVPLSMPFPGATVKVIPGALVILAFAYGDPGQRFALPIWGAGASLQQLVIGDVANDSITIGAGSVVVKIGGVQMLSASSEALALGLVGALQVLVLGALDSMGVPVTQAPAAVSSIVMAG